MARGWESKNVESQQEEASRAPKPARTFSPEEQARETHRRGLELARTRTQADLDRATLPAHRTMLEQAMAALDAQLRDLE